MSRRIVYLAKWPLLALLFAALSWGGWYIYDKGFGKRWRWTLAKEFERYGLVITARRLTLDPFHGLSAREVQVFDTESRQMVLAEISDISLDINYANLFQHEAALNAVDLRGARISIPLDPEDPHGKKIEIDRLHARIYFLPGRIEVRQVSGDLYGIQLTASGTLVNPAQLRFTTPFGDENSGSDKDSAAKLVRKFVDEVRAMRFPGEPPRLDLTFQVDLADPGSLRIQGGRLSAESILREDYRLYDFNAEFSLENRRLELQKIQVRDAKGELFATASWDLTTGGKRFRVRSSLDLAQLLGGEPRCPWAKDWTFDAPPQLELSGFAKVNRKTQFFGKLAFDQFSFRSVPFQSMKAEFSRAGDSWMISNAEVTHRTGTLAGDVLHVPGDFRMRIHSALNPTALIPLFPARVQRALADWEFQTPPVVQASFSGPRPEFRDIRGSGEVWLGRTRLRGAFMNSASATFRVQDQAVDYKDVRIARDEGSGTGAFTYDFGNGEVRIHNAEANLYPAALAAWTDPALLRAIQPFRFSQPPKIRADGIVQFRNGGTKDLGMQIEIPSSFNYEFAGLDIPFDSATAELSVKPDRVEMTRFDARIGDGTWSMECTAKLPITRNVYEARVRLSKVELPKLATRIGHLRGYEGFLSGELKVKHRGIDRLPPSVAGSIRVTQARISASPLFMPLSERLASLGLREPAELTMEFRLEQAVAEIDALRITSRSHALSLKGTLDLLGGAVDLVGDVDDNALRLRASGNIQEPIWQLSSNAPY
jgi:hypothetical protein